MWIEKCRFSKKMKIAGKPTWPRLGDPKEFGLKAIKTSVRKLKNFSDSISLDEEGKITSEMQFSLPLKGTHLACALWASLL